MTPDSFSDGGRFFDPQAALDQALRMEVEGADLIDVGAESTRPGAKEIPAEEERARLEGILNRLTRYLKIPFSIDTRKAAVARWAVREGAGLLNDVSGFGFDPQMLSVLREEKIPAILMHSRGTPETMGRQNQYRSLVEDLGLFFEERLARLEGEGILREKILLDPGVGFAKVGRQNLEILKNLDRFRSFGRPLVVGLSRKSFLEEYFGPTAHPADRGVGTEIAHTLAILRGANILRVHDVAAAKKTIRFVKEAGGN